MTSSQKNPKLCPDWIYLNNCNAHVAKDRAYFTSYTPFQSTITPLAFGAPAPVYGIGTVKLRVRVSPSSNASTDWELRDVLHVPTFVCNALGNPIMTKAKCSVEISNDGASNGHIYDAEEREVGYFLPGRPLFVLAIEAPQGQMLGPPVIVDEGTKWMISCRWDEGERRRWEEYKAKPSRSVGKAPGVQEKGELDGYSEAEKGFLKRNWRNEFWFLAQYGLNIYKEEDREEGRAILRALMSKEK